jgi:uncharacterized radical SAM superfamily Fe-S cluster-containing enzyme
MTLPKKDIYINSTLAYCKHCGQSEMARIVAKKSGVFMERLCPTKGANSVKIAADYKWYMDRVTVPQNISRIKNAKKSQQGCPFDCGICEWHSGLIQRAVFSITNDIYCNYSGGSDSNRIDKEYYKSLEEIKKIINHVLEETGGIDIINLTGKESLLHPYLFDIIEMCKRQGIKQITIDTDGLKGFDDFEFAQKIKQSNVKLVLLLDTFNTSKSIKIHGIDVAKKKLETLQILESLNIPSDILLGYIKGINEEDIAGIAQEYIKKEFVRNIIIQDQIFNGGNYYQSSCRGTIDEVEKLLATGENISQEDFSALATCHPLCSSVAYYIAHNQKIIPLSKILDKNDLIRISEKCCCPNPDKDFSRIFWDGVNRLWSDGENHASINVLKQFIKKIYPPNGELSINKRWEYAEKMIKAVFIHQYMDENNFDIDRVSRCGDIVIDKSDRLIPVCSYNLLHH